MLAVKRKKEIVSKASQTRKGKTDFSKKITKIEGKLLTYITLQCRYKEQGEFLPCKT